MNFAFDIVEFDSLLSFEVISWLRSTNMIKTQMNCDAKLEKNITTNPSRAKMIYLSLPWHRLGLHIVYDVTRSGLLALARQNLQ